MNPFEPLAPGYEGLEWGPVVVWRFDPAVARDLQVNVMPAHPLAQADVIDDAWNELTRLNPRLFDGPIMHVETFDSQAPSIAARLDRYRRVAVHPRCPTGVMLLAVRAVLVAKDDAGREHTLIGARHPTTRVYGGLWENGPSGGMPAPPKAPWRLELEDFRAHLAQEAIEEVGISIDSGTVTPLGFCRDQLARGFDVVLRVDLPETIASLAIETRQRDWEYTAVRWLPVDQVQDFDQEMSSRLIPPTKAIWRMLGWAG